MGSRQQGNVLSSLVFPVVFVIVFVLLTPFPPVCCEPHFSHAKGRVCKGAAMVEQIPEIIAYSANAKSIEIQAVAMERLLDLKA